MKSTSFLPLQILAAATLLSSAAADSLDQSKTFAQDNADALFSGSGSASVCDSNLFSTTFAPFDASLGTLLSSTVTCDISVQISGKADPESEEPGSGSSTLGGTFKLGGLGFNGTGAGSGPVTAAPGDELDASFDVPFFSYTFMPENAGVSYDPAIQDFITGKEEYTFDFELPGNRVEFANVIDLSTKVTGTITMTYEYEPASGGPKATFTITKLLRAAGTGDVTLTWDSAAGKSYAVEASEDLSKWDAVAPTVPAGSGNETSWTESSIPTTSTSRFYRVREVK